ncbi:MAG TPA: small ribosomal subunit Rsm22 family protein [Bryobacteraceae bacterium]|nr:small ribosomal subunit Rsm22 family protein [Bryobacteraceae bacterium]
MHPPEFVQRLIDRYAAAIPYSRLERASAALSDSYRSGQKTADVKLAAEDRVAAYLVTRMPATYAAVFHVLREIAGRIEVRSILDLGAGAGAAMVAALQIFEGLKTLTLVEADDAFRQAGMEFVPAGKWIARDLRQCEPLPEADLVIASYSLGELGIGVLERAWQTARTALVLIEPGSPAGFRLIREARDKLLSKGAHMLAPCPGEGVCPIPPGDWCHFGQRVERSALHRRMKHATLSYEDEKFSYVAVSRADCGRVGARLIRRPIHYPGLIELVVCRGDRIASEAIQKRHKESFRRARKLSWGDPV